MRPIVSIIGTGQLGSRHLQGLALCPISLDIHCVDTSTASLEMAKGRWKEAPANDHTLSFHESLEALPPFNDIVIVASNSNARRSIIEEIVLKKKVRYFILEKILFQQIGDYPVIDRILEENGIEAFVNCPRRMYDSYREIGADAGGKLSFNVMGNNWGLGSNTIHFLDLFVFLTRNEDLKVCTDGIDRVMRTGKREGYYEFSGTLTGCNSTGDTFQISSLEGNPTPIWLDIFTGSSVYRIEEGVVMRYAGDDTGWKWTEKEHKIHYQSQLTYKVVLDLLNLASCSLTPYRTSASIHCAFIRPLLATITKYCNWTATSCPIT